MCAHLLRCVGCVDMASTHMHCSFIFSLAVDCSKGYSTFYSTVVCVSTHALRGKVTCFFVGEKTAQHMTSAIYS